MKAERYADQEKRRGTFEIVVPANMVLHQISRYASDLFQVSFGSWNVLAMMMQPLEFLRL